MSDPLLDLVGRLPGATMSLERSRRTQARCHRVLTRATTTRVTARRRPSAAWVRAVVGVSAVYVFEVLRLLVRVYSTR